MNDSTDFTAVFIVIVIIFIIFIYKESKTADLVSVVSRLDNKEYKVRKAEDSIDAADLMASIRQSLDSLCDHLKVKYPNKKNVGRLIKKFKSENIRESASNSKYTSYSINKGEKIVLCMRSKETQQLEKKNTLLFVSLHELAHIMTLSVGHTDEFWNNFRFLLKQAVKLGIYKHVDFSSNPEPYCGITITDSPL